MSDAQYMQRALQLAQLGIGKVSPNPMVGCVIVNRDRIIGEGYHQHYGGPHAEVNAITDVVDKEILKEATVYVTLEPCLMCFGACIHARIDRLIFATEDQKSGAVINNLNLQEESFFNHKISVSSGILGTESSELLKKFFQERRN